MQENQKTKNLQEENIVSQRVQELLSMVFINDTTSFLSDSEALFRRDFHVVEEEIEKNAVSLMLQNTDKNIQSLLGPLSDYKDLIEQELLLLDDNVPAWCGKVVFAGAGALPLSPILLSQKGNFDITCFDLDTESACLASIFLDHFYPALNLKYEISDAVKFDYKNYDVVFISSMTNPKDLILKQVRKTNPNACIVTRVPDHKFNRFYNILPENIITASGYRVKKSIKARNTMHRSLLLVPCDY